MILAGIKAAGYKAGKDVVLAMDPAASEFYKNGRYVFSKSDQSVRNWMKMTGSTGRR